MEVAVIHSAEYGAMDRKRTSVPGIGVGHLVRMGDEKDAPADD